MSILLLLANTAATERQEQTSDCERPPAPSEFPPGPNLPRPRSQLTLEVKPLAAPSQEGQLGPAAWGLCSVCAGGPTGPTASSAGHAPLRKPGPGEPRSCRPPLVYYGEGNCWILETVENKQQAELRPSAPGVSSPEMDKEA